MFFFHRDRATVIRISTQIKSRLSRHNSCFLIMSLHGNPRKAYKEPDCTEIYWLGNMKNRVLIASVFTFCLMGAVTGAWAITESRATAQSAASLFSKIDSTCDNPDATCAALLNQL